MNATQKIPSLSIVCVVISRKLKETNSFRRVAVVLMLEPTEVLESLRVLRILTKCPFVHFKSGLDVALELINVTDLIPTIGARERRWRIGGDDNLVEVPESFVKVLLFLIYNTDTKANFISSLKIGRDGKHGEEGF